MLHLKSKHPVQLAEVCNLNMLLESGLESIDGLDATSTNGAITHMHCDDNEDFGILAVLVKYCLINFALEETKAAKDGDKLLIPPLASLLEPIKGLPKLKDLLSVVFRISRGVMHV